MKTPAGFKSAVKKARGYVEHGNRLAGLMANATTKAERQQGRIRSFFLDVYTLIRLVRAWARGSYRRLPLRTILWSVAALLYFVDPFDLIPDAIPFFGYLDDAAVVGFVIKAISTDLAKFVEWEQSA